MTKTIILYKSKPKSLCIIRSKLLRYVVLCLACNNKTYP